MTTLRRITPWLLLGVFALEAPAQQQRLNQYDTRYYELHTSLDAEHAREAIVRITAMAELYNDRTSGFAGQITRKFPFYLYTSAQDYRAAGGMPNTAGMYDGRKLMAWTPREPDERFWSVVQHEGFHQFVDRVIRGNIPVWVNEGLAEYFGAARFTGDGYVTARVPRDYLAAIQAVLAAGRTISVEQIMNLGTGAWNHSVTSGGGAIHYAQAWSMTHFLAHANPRYQKAFVAFINDCSRGAGWQVAWENNFGRGTREFEQQWRDYWLKMSPQDVERKEVEVTVATLTSFLARAVSQDQEFASFDDFAQKAEAGKLMAHRDDWLPPSLLERALSAAARGGKWELRRRRGYEFSCTLKDGSSLTGAFALSGKRVRRGSVTVRVLGAD